MRCPLLAAVFGLMHRSITGRCRKAMLNGGNPKESFTIFGKLALQTQPFAYSRRDGNLEALTSTL